MLLRPFCVKNNIKYINNGNVTENPLKQLLVYYYLIIALTNDFNLVIHLKLALI